MNEEIIERRIQTMTFHQVRNLRIVRTDEKVIVIGQCSTYYVKQLVTQAVIDLLPEVNLCNELQVQ